MKKILAIQITALILVSASLSGMFAFTDVYDEVYSRIVSVICLSCIKLNRVYSIDYKFETANGEPHPGFIINDLEKNQTIWGYSAVIDEEKLGQKQFFILIKKLATKPPDRQAEIALDKARREKLEKAEIFIEGSYYTHGSHDWILIVNAKNIIEITKLVESIRKDYHDFISEIQIIEIMFPVVKEGKENPKKTNLKEFF